MITRQQIEERLTKIRAEQTKALQHAQMCAGAAQDCEYWLKAWDEAEMASKQAGPVDPSGWGLPDAAKTEISEP